MLLATSCAGRKWSPSAAQSVHVIAVAVDFPTRDRGSLDFTLELPTDAPSPKSVTWELFLDGTRFAAGLEGQLVRKDGKLEIHAPLVSRHLAWREGEATLDVGLKGEVDVGRPGENLAFKERRELPVTGRPVWTAPE